MTEGAELLVDGRGFKLQGYESGFSSAFRSWITSHAAGMRWPLRRRSWARLLRIVRATLRGETVSLAATPIWRSRRRLHPQQARRARVLHRAWMSEWSESAFPSRCQSLSHFRGSKRSAFGDTDRHGMEGVKFSDGIETVTARWPEGMSRIRPCRPDDAVNFLCPGSCTPYHASVYAGM